MLVTAADAADAVAGGVIYRVVSRQVVRARESRVEAACKYVGFTDHDRTSRIASYIESRCVSVSRRVSVSRVDQGSHTYCLYSGATPPWGPRIAGVIYTLLVSKAGRSSVC